MRKLSTKDLTLAAMVAAVYTVLTVFLPIPQYGEVQFRIAECMTVLPFLFPWATPGLIVGCFLANLLGSPFVLDWVFGTLATALACFMTARMPNKWLAPLPPVLCNAIIVGAEIAIPQWAASAAPSGLRWDPLPCPWALASWRCAISWACPCWPCCPRWRPSAALSRKSVFLPCKTPENHIENTEYRCNCLYKRKEDVFNEGP